MMDPNERAVMIGLLQTIARLEDRLQRIETRESEAARASRYLDNIVEDHRCIERARSEGAGA